MREGIKPGKIDGFKNPLAHQHKKEAIAKDFFGALGLFNIGVGEVGEAVMEV